MNQLQAINHDVYFDRNRFPKYGQGEIDFLKDQVNTSSKGRVRICFHSSEEDRLNEMLIVFRKDSFIRPSRHIGKDESLFIIEGSGFYCFFEEDGNVFDIVELNTLSANRYCRINAGVIHALLISTELFIAKETISGPFAVEDTVFPDWSPQSKSDISWPNLHNKILSYAEKEKDRGFVDRLVLAF